jgi:hypothetical protein
MRKILLQAVSFLLLPCFCWSQAQPKLSPPVLQFVREDAQIIALAHVRVIDGTAAAARTEQTLIIANGKIAASATRQPQKFPSGQRCLISLAARLSWASWACTITCTIPHPVARRRSTRSTRRVFHGFIWREA